VKAENESDERVRSCAEQVAYMFDQCHNLKHKIEATIQSAVTVQETYAKALLVDYDALGAAQRDGDLLMAEEILKDAYHSDVRELLRDWRTDNGLDPDPIAAFRRSGYAERSAEKRSKKHGMAATGAGFQ